MKDRDVEIRDRAMAILGVSSAFDTDVIRRNFLRQIRLVHPDGPQRNAQNVPGFRNVDVARLLIQAYGHLLGRHGPTTMLEDDALVGTLLDGQITPMSQTQPYTQWQATRFYDQFRHSIWPDAAGPDERHKESRFKGI